MNLTTNNPILNPELTKRHLVFCRDIDSPSGGRKMLYWLVDFLNSQNQTAYIVHQKIGFKSSWFNHETSIAYTFNHGITSNAGLKQRLKGSLYKMKCILKNIKPINLNPETDILYFPETFINQINSSDYNAFKKWIVNQNAFFMLKQNVGALNQLSQLNNQSLRILNFSKINIEYSSIIFENIASQIRVSAFVDPIFQAVSNIPPNKKKQIAVMPRRGNIQLQGIRKILLLKGIIEPEQWIEIDHCTQVSVKSTLLDSLIFLSFSEFEGLGLPIAEAMCCNCLVLGSTASGGEELFKYNGDFKIEHGNWLDAVKKISEIFSNFQENPKAYNSHLALNKAYILENYTKESAENTLKNHINQLSYLGES